MTTQMGFAELLDLFTSEDLEHALRDLGDPVSGGKAERIERLVQLGNTREPEDVLESFDESALGRACLRLARIHRWAGMDGVRTAEGVRELQAR